MVKPVATVGAHGLMSYSNDRDPLPYGSKLYDAAAIESLQTELAQAREQVEELGIDLVCSQEMAKKWQGLVETNLNLNQIASRRYEQQDAELIQLRAQLAAAMEFIQRVSKQTPEKPDYWSSCGQCERNASDAEDIVDSTTPPGGSSDG